MDPATVSNYCQFLMTNGRAKVIDGYVTIRVPYPDVNKPGFASWDWLPIERNELDLLLTYYGMEHPCVNEKEQCRQFTDEFLLQYNKRPRTESLSIDEYFSIYGSSQRTPINFD
jgi:hypothetical protein